MLKTTFWLDGKDARDYGIFLQRPVEISGAMPEVETVHVQGRNGDLVFETGAYLNRTGTAACFALYRNVDYYVSAASAFLLGGAGYRRLEIPEDDEHYYLARITNGAGVQSRLKLLNPFEIQFDIMPQAWLKSGAGKLVFTSTGYLNNPYSGKAKPLLKVNGSGAGAVNINGTAISITSIADYIMLDCETELAYKGTVNLNSSVNAPKYPVLDRGQNEIAFSGGVTSIEITPRWWDV